MTASSVSDKTYFNLGGEERFRAMISAACRKDAIEMDRLIDTCPEKLYRMRDADFKAPMEKFVFLASMHNTEVLRAITAFLFGREMARIYEREGAHDEKADQLQDVGLGILGARIRAWDRFCSFIGVDPTEVQRGFGISDMEPAAMVLRAADEVFSEYLFEAEDEKRFAEIEANYFEALSDAWLKATS